jgi:HPt (histidine-containing phosphotransfer) domain-containing protein
VFDRQALAARLMGDEVLLQDIVTGFMEDAPRQIRCLRDHVREGDAASAGARAHALNGAAANVGGMALSATAFEIERAGREGRLDAVAALLPELECRFDVLQEHMRGDRR